MRTFKNIVGIVFLLLTVGLVQAQEPEKAAPKSETLTNSTSTVQKAQNNNTVRSNRTDGKISSEQPGSSGNSDAALSKKGYDYYKAKSELNAAGMQNNPKSQTPDHNSSRSNKSSSSIAVENNSGTGSSGEKDPSKK